MGKNCESECPNGLWGSNCMKHCLCMHGGECNKENGECECVDGWTGPSCEFCKSLNQTTEINH